MSGVARVVQQVARAVAVLAGLVALGGIVALVAAGLYAAEQSGVAVPVTVPITADRAEQFIVSGAIGLVAGVVVNLLANTVANFAAGFRSGQVVAERRAATGAAGGEGDDDVPSVPVSERHRRKLARTYLWITGFVALILVVGSVGSVAGGGSALEVALALAAIAVDLLFGGVAGGLAVVALLLGLWYGVRQRATEALVAGFAVAVLFLATAVAIRSVGWVILALMLLYYNFLSRGATEFRWLRAENVPGPVREFVQ